jgi:hypothetical protein
LNLYFLLRTLGQDFFEQYALVSSVLVDEVKPFRSLSQDVVAG